MLLAVAGASLSPRLPLERIRTAPGDTLVVRARAPGLDPLQIEQLVTRPLERAFAGLPALQNMVGRSGEGVARIELRFSSTSARERALVDVQALVGLAAPKLPTGLDVPGVERLDPAPGPAVIYAVVAQPLSTEVAAWAQQHLRRPLHELRKAAAVNLDGVETREVLIQPDPRRLVVLGLSFDDVIEALRTGDSAPAGSSAGRLAASPTSVEALAARAVRLESGEPIALSEVAEVSILPRPAAEHPQHDGRPAFLLSVYPGAAGQAVAVADRVKAHIGWLKANGIVPGEVKLKKLFDESAETQQWLRRASRHVGAAIALVVIVAYAFLGLRPALVLLGAFAVWLPLSATALWAAGMTLNAMTVAAILFGGVALVLLVLRLAAAPLLAALALMMLMSAWFWRDAFGVYAQGLSGFSVLVFVAMPVAWLVAGVARAADETTSPFLRRLPRSWRARSHYSLPMVALFLIAAGWYARALPLSVGAAAGGGTLALRLYGPEERQLPVVADGMRAKLRGMPGIFDVSDPLQSHQRWHLQLDEEKLQAAEIGILEVGRHFEIARRGLVVGQLTDADAQMPLRVQLAPGAAGAAFERLLLRGERKERAALYLRDVGTAELANLRRERLRVQRQPALEIRAHWRGAALPDEVARLPETAGLPAGYALQLDAALTFGPERRSFDQE